MPQDYLNLDSARERHELDDLWEYTHRRHRMLTAAVIVLFLALGGGAWYLYPVLQTQESSLSRISGLEESVNSLNQEVKNTNSKVGQWSGSEDYLRQQVTQLGRDLLFRMASARKQADNAWSAMSRRFQAQQTQMDTQASAVEKRLTQVELSHENDQTQIAGLQRDLNQTQTDVARNGSEMADARRQMDGNSANVERQITSLQQNSERNQQDVRTIAGRLAVDRVDFEVSKGHSRQLAPGISLGLTGTDVRYRRASGWMWIMPDRRTLWLRGQSAQEPVIFYGYEDGKKREMVITQVTKDSVVGYLILPAGTGQNVTASLER